MKYENVAVFPDTDEIAIPIPESIRDCIALARSDYYRYTGKSNASLWTMLWATWRNYNFAVCLWFRLAKVKSLLFPFFRWKLECANRKHGLCFSRNIKCGYGLHIVHAVGIVVNCTAIIGNNVTLHQHTNVGSDKDNAAVLGDNVYIGPQVCLVENVHIGSNTVIGAGSIVVKDIKNGVAVGNPAKIVKDGNGAFVGHNQFKIPKKNVEAFGIGHCPHI